jgi:hypothetical protein
MEGENEIAVTYQLGILRTRLGNLRQNLAISIKSTQPTLAFEFTAGGIEFRAEVVD